MRGKYVGFILGELMLCLSLKVSKSLKSLDHSTNKPNGSCMRSNDDTVVGFFWFRVNRSRLDLLGLILCSSAPSLQPGCKQHCPLTSTLTSTLTCNVDTIVQTKEQSAVISSESKQSSSRCRARLEAGLPLLPNTHNKENTCVCVCVLLTYVNECTCKNVLSVCLCGDQWLSQQHHGLFAGV